MTIGPVDSEIIDLQGINDVPISAYRSESFNVSPRKLRSYWRSSPNFTLYTEITAAVNACIGVAKFQFIVVRPTG